MHNWVVRTLELQKRVRHIHFHSYYIHRLCKHHFCKAVKKALQSELKNVYRAPDKAYQAMDFTGRGYITQDDFLQAIFISRVLAAKIFTIEDIKEFFKQDNLFPAQTAISSGGLSFDKFKKLFFPRLFLINDNEESEDEKINNMNKQTLKVGINDDKDSEAQGILADRLKKMEKLLK